MLWRSHFSPDGELRKWLLADKRTPVAPWAPDRASSFSTFFIIIHCDLDFQERFIEGFRAGGWIAPTNWYRTIVQGFVKEGDKGQDYYQS
jgi:soluble epoxide hydrolase/lipid-phosphate phosphatase